MNISLAKRLNFISCRITVKSVRANLLGGGIEVTSSQLAVINSVRHFSVVDKTATRMKHFPRSMNGLQFVQFSIENMERVVIMNWKIKTDVCSKTKFNGVSGNGGKDPG